MARRLSKKKISGWLLLFAVIIFFRCGGYRKTASFVKNLSSKASHSQTLDESLAAAEIDEMLVHRLDSFVKTAYRVGSLGVYVYDETANQEVYSFNADSLMRPASNMKMLTCLTALRKLGPNYCFESGAYMKGETKGDTLEGDIALKFTFDPLFDNAKMAKLADAFRQKGIHRVTGKIIIDIKMREPMQHEEHWTIGDLKTRKLSMLYRGEQRMKNEVKYALRSHGVNFSDGQVVVARVPKGATKIAATRTPMRQSISYALMNSSNEHAECLTFAMSGMFLDGQNFREAGVRYLQNFIINELGCDPDAVSRIHDGCGLCVHDRLTPRFLVRMLHYAYAHKYIYQMLRWYLPVSGTSGTLRNRMHRPSVRGKIQAKTGTLTREDGITSLSGYVTTPDGHLILFGVIQNEVPVADARIWQDRFCEQLVKAPRGVKK